ncbi:hypothetical protein [Thiolapillus sp.]
MVLVIAVYILLDSGLIPWGYVRSAPISGTIIDQETGQPIPHAVISIRWPQMRGTPGGTIYVGSGTIKRIEVVSDEQGNYLVPGWKRSKWEIGEGGFSKDRPEMHIYAAGYWPRTLRNKQAGRLGWGEAWKADWDGQDIELEPMHWREWTKEEWERKGKELWGAAINYWEKCQWVRFPENVVENIQFRIRKKEMVDSFLDVCGDGMEFLRRAKEQCWIDAFGFLSQYGLTEEEWKACRVEIQDERAVQKSRRIPMGKLTFPPMPWSTKDLKVVPYNGKEGKK